MTTLVPDLPQVEVAIVKLTNDVRRQSNVNAVVVSAQLTAAARAYAKLLATTGQFTHEAGNRPDQRLAQAGYTACGFAENIAMRRDQNGYETQALALSVIAGWVASPTHARNLRAATMTEVGVGVATSPGKAGEFIAVQVFGRPQTQGLVFHVQNTTQEPVTVAFEGHSRDVAAMKTYTLRACSVSQLAFTAKSASTPFLVLQAANGKTYRITAPSKIEISPANPDGQRPRN